VVIIFVFYACASIKQQHPRDEHDDTGWRSGDSHTLMLAMMMMMLLMTVMPHRQRRLLSSPATRQAWLPL
jgi:hypothetical protein